MSKRFDNRFVEGMLNAVFTTIFKPKDLPANFFDLLDINRRKIVVEFDRTQLKVDHDVISASFENLVKPLDILPAFGDCRKAVSEVIERTLPEYEFTMMYLEGDCRASERGYELMELSVHTMLCKMLLMSQMNVRFSFTPEHLWIEIVKKDPKAVFTTHSSLILYANAK